MIRIRHFVLATLFSGMCICLASAQQHSAGAIPSYTLQCHGVTGASTALKDGAPKAIVEKSIDTLRIVRHGRTLSVLINAAQYNSMSPEAKKILQKPDSYIITAETGEGFVAVFENGSTTLHTLMIDRSLSYGIWTESGFSFLPPQSEPISRTVSLTCTQEIK